MIVYLVLILFFIIEPLPVRNVTTDDRTHTRLTISWEGPGDSALFDQYYVTYERADKLAERIEIGYLDYNISWVYVRGLTPFTEYIFNIYTVSGEGDAEAFSTPVDYSEFTSEYYC